MVKNNTKQKATIALSTLFYSAAINALLAIGIPLLSFYASIVLLPTSLGLALIYAWGLIFPAAVIIITVLIVPPVSRNLKANGLDNSAKVLFFSLLFVIDITLLINHISNLLTGISNSSFLLGYLILFYGLNVISFYLSFLLFNRFNKFLFVLIIILILLLNVIVVLFEQAVTKQQNYQLFKSWNFQIYAPPNYEKKITEVSFEMDTHDVDITLAKPWDYSDDIREYRALYKTPEQYCHVLSKDEEGPGADICSVYTNINGVIIYKYGYTNENGQGYFEVRGNTLITGFSSKGWQYATLLASLQPVNNLQFLSSYDINIVEKSTTNP